MLNNKSPIIWTYIFMCQSIDGYLYKISEEFTINPKKKSREFNYIIEVSDTLAWILSCVREFGT